jgi:hypothetical protein
VYLGEAAGTKTISAGKKPTFSLRTGCWTSGRGA